MYEKFFGLRCMPFEDRIQLEFLFTNPDIEEVLASMECELRYRQGLGFVVGESGTGKTLLIRSLLTKLDPQDPAIVVKCPVDGQMDIIRETCKGFGVTLPTQYNAKRGLARLRRRLEDARRQDRLPVLIVDQAENLSIEAMSTLESLIDLGRDDNRLLTMLLVGQPRTIDMLGQPRFDRLRQQLASELRLHKFTSAQTQEYIAHRLRIAGAGDKEIFDPAAIAVVHIITHGIPRLINRLADASMVAAYSAGQSSVTAELVREMSANQSQKSQPSKSIVCAVQEDALMSKLVSRVDSTIQAMKGDDINVAASNDQGDDATNMSERARTLITKLEQTLRHAEQTTTKLEHRAKSIVVEVQDQLGELENESMRIGGAANEVQPQLHRIENTCDRAVKVEAQLSAFAETLVERADSVQQRISLLMTAMTDADACRENIHNTAQQATDIIEQSQQTSQAIQEGLDQVRKELKESQRASHDAAELVRKQISHVSEDAQRQASQAIQGRLEQARKELKESHRASHDAAELASQQISHVSEDAQRQYAMVIEKEKNQLAKTLSEVVNESIVGFKSSLSKLTKDALDEQREATKQMTSEFVAAMQGAWAKTRADATRDVEKITVIKEEAFRHNVDTVSKEFVETIEVKAAQTRQEVSKLQDNATIVMHTTKKQLAQLTLQHVDQEKKHNSLVGQQVELDAQIEDLCSRANATKAMVQDLQSTVVELQRQPQETLARLSSAVDSGRAMTTDVNNACGRVESLQRSISNSLLEVGGACERLNSLSEKASHAEKVSTNIEHMLCGQNGHRESIQSLINKADKTVGLLQPAIATADEKILHVEKMSTKLGHMLSERDGQTDSLQRLVNKADKAVELLQPAIAAADEKAGRLQSHHAAASSLLKKLTQVNVDGQSVMQQVEKASANAQQLAEETTAKIDRMIQDVWDLSAKAEATSKMVSDTYAQAQIVTPQPKDVQQTTTAENIKDFDDQIGQHVDDVALRSEAYEKLTDQVNTIAKVLSKAQAVAKSTREELVDAKETYENLTTISGTANQQITSLDTLIKSAGCIIETHEQLQLETTTSTQELQQHLSAMADTTDAGMQMINEFTKQTIDIEKQLRVATRKSAQLQANVAEALAQPGEIVAGAKEHAAQLEQVCTAVRKVFSALSKSSLDAQEQIKQFNESRTEAQTDMAKLKNTTIQVSERIQSITKSGLGSLQSTAKQAIEQVRHESSRSSQTLSEWVQETNRAQQRLEHTLQSVPPISQTHPIHGVTHAARQIPAFNGPEAKLTPDQGYDLLAEKQAPVETVTMIGADQAARKAKIKQLLEEAKRASVNARS